MKIATTCSNCQKSFSVAPELAGKKVRCSSCNTVFQVAGSPEAGSGPPVQAKAAPKPAPQKPVVEEQSPYESLAASLLNDPKGKNFKVPRAQKSGFKSGNEQLAYGVGASNANLMPEQSVTRDLPFDEGSLIDAPIFADNESDDTGFAKPGFQTSGSPASFQSSTPYVPPKRKTAASRSSKSEFNEARAQAGYSIMGLGIIGMFAPLFGLELKFVGSFGAGYWFVAGLIVLAGCAFVLSACPGNLKKGLSISAIPALFALGGMIFSIGLILNGDRTSGNTPRLASNHSGSRNLPGSRSSSPTPSFSVPVGSNSPYSRSRSDELESRTRNDLADHDAHMSELEKQAEEAFRTAQRSFEEPGNGKSRTGSGGNSSNPFGSAGAAAQPSRNPINAFGDEEPARTAPLPSSRGTPGFDASLVDMKPGLNVHILWGSSWYKGNVVSVQGESINVHYEGWSSNSDEAVDISRIRLMEESADASGSDAEPFGLSGNANANRSGSSVANLKLEFPKDDQFRLTVTTNIANNKLANDFKAKYGAKIWLQDQKKMISPSAGTVGKFPVYAVHLDRIPVLGAQISWSYSNDCLGTVGPVFDMSSNAKILVREGYVVSGINVNADSKVRGVQFVCSRNVDGSPDPADTYSSDWYGKPASEGNEIVIGGDGRKVYGIWVSQENQGLESIGLIIDPAK